MLKVGLVGIGFMGHGHLDQYLRLMKEGKPVKLVALCDVNQKQFEEQFTGGNMGDLGKAAYDFSQFHLYNTFEDMMANEPDLDYVDIALPTYLHSYYAIKALNAGKHVLCEKPMAINPTQCRMMIDAAKANNKKLMIAQCLRFWPAYETLKKYVESGEFGKPVFCYFYRGGGWPKWSFQDWLLDENRAGGALLDQHVHDVDMVNWLFGMPEAVSTLGRNVGAGQGFDAVTTQYRFDGFIVNTADDWSINSPEYPFSMTYRANFEKGCIEFKDGVTKIYPLEGEAFEADNCGGDDGYYREIKYFINAVVNDTAIETADVESTYRTICLATAERDSARNNGEWTTVLY